MAPGRCAHPPARRPRGDGRARGAPGARSGAAAEPPDPQGTSPGRPPPHPTLPPAPRPIRGRSRGSARPIRVRPAPSWPPPPCPPAGSGSRPWGLRLGPQVLLGCARAGRQRCACALPPHARPAAGQMLNWEAQARSWAGLGVLDGLLSGTNEPFLPPRRHHQLRDAVAQSGEGEAPSSPRFFPHLAPPSGHIAYSPPPRCGHRPLPRRCWLLALSCHPFGVFDISIEDAFNSLVLGFQDAQLCPGAPPPSIVSWTLPSPHTESAPKPQFRDSCVPPFLQ